MVWDAAVQAPAPSQTLALFKVVTLAQLAATQVVSAPLYTHESDVPSHVPAHVGLVAVHGVCPARGGPETRVQAPTELHTWHCPVQADEQQTPSAQKADAHSSLLPQVVPGSDFFTQTPDVLQ